MSGSHALEAQVTNTTNAAMAVTARQIITSLLPSIRIAARYADKLQGTIQDHSSKTHYGANFFATALSDADLSIQTLIETALLSEFPSIRFFGEEYEHSVNTKYFTGIDFGGQDELLVTLDPIDATRCYLDKRSDYQIVLTVMTTAGYEAVLIARPASNLFLYADKKSGVLQGSLSDDTIETARPLKYLATPTGVVTTGFGARAIADSLGSEFTSYSPERDYHASAKTPDVLDIVTGKADASLCLEANLIDSFAIAFLAEQQGCVVSDLNGNDITSFCCHRGMKLGPFVVARNSELRDKVLSHVAGKLCQFPGNVR